MVFPFCSRYLFVVLTLAPFHFLHCIFRPGAPDEAAVQRNAGATYQSGQCAVHIPQAVAAVWDGELDLFREHVLDSPLCGPDIVAVERALVAAGCLTRGRAYVSEKGQLVNTVKGVQVDTRLVDVWECAESGSPDSFPERNPFNKIFINNGARGAAHGVREHFEIIAPVKDGSGFHFYVQHSSEELQANFIFVGNSVVQTPRLKEYPPFVVPCMRCHRSGSLLMTEAHFPWANWFRFGGPMADLPAMEKALEVPGSVPKAPLIAEHLEILVLQAQMDANERRIQAMFAGEPMTFLQSPPGLRAATLRDLLRPLFCETEILIQANDFGNGISSTDPAKVGAREQLNVPRDLFINRLLVPLRKKDATDLQLLPRGVNTLMRTTENKKQFRHESRLYSGSFTDNPDFAAAAIEADGEKFYSPPDRSYGLLPVMQKDWVSFLRGRPELVLRSVASELPDDASPRAALKWGKYPFPVPARAFSDDDFVSRLLNQGRLEERLVLAALLTDFTRPVFSSKRCGLLEAVPETPASQYASDGGARRITDDVLASARSLRSKFKTQLGAPDVDSFLNVAEAPLDTVRLASRVQSYLDACQKSTLLKGERVAELYRYFRGRRSALLRNAHRLNFEPELNGEIFFEFDGRAHHFLSQFSKDEKLQLLEDCETLVEGINL